MVGRAEEMAVLEAALARAQDGSALDELRAAHGALAPLFP
jgi:hypothetical protein